ncbi:MAG: carboxyl-terminal protease [Akkermansiaceae bacterium]|nr:carboxyl-terminal protease [Akkermansiaceae bacterium]
MKSSVLSALILLGLSYLSAAAPPTPPDFDEVGRQMAIMLQNGHFSRLPFSQVSGRFLDHYLKLLDPGKAFFTARDVADFHRDYSGSTLGEMLLKEEALAGANKIYGVYRSRVASRVAEAKRLLAENRFDFTGNETAPLGRWEEPWPAGEAESMARWQQSVKAAVLEEILRRENSGDQSGDPATPQTRLAARYERLLTSVTAEQGPGEVAALFLSAVAQSFDPHTDYMNAAEVVSFNDEMRHQTIGIGTLLQSAEDGATEVKGLVIHGPADLQGGLQPGDRITAVDPDADGPRELTDIGFMKLDRVIGLVRGERGTKVTLKVNSPAGPERKVTIVRDEVPLEDRQASAGIVEMPAGQPQGARRRLGVITLPSFYRDFENGQTSCGDDVGRLLVRLKAGGIDGLLFDLRGNGGGALIEAQRITGLFTKAGPVVQVKDGIGRVDVLGSEDREPVYNGPLVVLTDRGSASASEIMAAALQDDGRAVIAGDSSTFGKGTVQIVRNIGEQMPFFAARRDAGALRLTIQKFYRPSGVSTQNRGVVPDLLVAGSTDAWELGESSLDEALEQDRIAPAASFHPADRARLHLPELAAQSTARMAASADFAETRQDAARLKERLTRNEVSLNLDTRRAESAANAGLLKEREAGRRVRFAAQEAADREQLGFYTLALNNESLWKADPATEDPSHLRLEAAAGALKWPSRLDPQKRESLAILRDLVEMQRAG